MDPYRTPAEMQIYSTLLQNRNLDSTLKSKYSLLQYQSRLYLQNSLVFIKHLFLFINISSSLLFAFLPSIIPLVTKSPHSTSKQ